MKVRFTEEQIIKILKEHEGGKKAVDIVREYNIHCLLNEVFRVQVSDMPQPDKPKSLVLNGRVTFFMSCC